jgi:signal transduction histidine kinase
LIGLALSLFILMTLTRSLMRERGHQERLRNELKQSEQLAALGKLLAGVAHEIKNPLAAIRSTVQLWERLPATTKTEDSTKAILQSVDRLDDILRRLLLFARAESRDRRPCEINRLLSDTFTLLEAQAAGQNVKLDLELQWEIPSVSGSATMLHQVFLNLVLNALQAMPNGGHLSASTKYNAKTRMVEVKVADTGPGISAEDRTHLFQPFFTTKPDGTGLGLALCHEVVQQHGGRIELVCGEGGAVFLVSLPANMEHG